MAFGFGAPLASFWGPMAGGLIGGLGQRSANRETAKSTAKQIAFQRDMSNTAHQRQVRDLKAAGINPMLSAKLGGASTPQGASYTAQNVGSAAVQGYQAVSSARQAQAQTRQIDAQTQFTKQQTENAIQENKNLKQAFKVAKQQERVLSEDVFIKKLTGNMMNLDNTFYHDVSEMLGQSIGPKGIQSAHQAADLVLKAIAQGGKAASYVLDKFFPGRKTPNVNLRGK
jgi:hypothetical protein